MDLEQRMAELEQLVQEQGEKIAALEVEAQKRQDFTSTIKKEQFVKNLRNCRIGKLIG